MKEEHAGEVPSIGECIVTLATNPVSNTMLSLHVCFYWVLRVSFGEILECDTFISLLVFLEGIIFDYNFY